MESPKRPLVLIVDDNAQNLRVLAEVVQNSGYEPVMATSGAQAFDFLAAERPDLILLDVMMPELDGYQICARIKEDPALAAIPIIFLTARARSEDVVRGFAAGAVDYVSKPFNGAELRARMGTQLEVARAREKIQALNAELLSANERIQLKNAKLEQLNAELSVASATDPLTHLFNRRRMQERLERELGRAPSELHPIALLLADIDHFKQINDEHGHLVGDRVLQTVAMKLAGSVRGMDAVSRWGGEEFLILINAPQEGALQVAERLRRVCVDRSVVCGGEALCVTLTIGVALHQPGEGIEETVRRADDALYQGKRQGRNQVVLAPPSPPPRAQKRPSSLPA